MVHEVHHFHHGLVNPLIGYVMSALGCLLGLVFAARARQVRGARRLRLLSYAAIAIGGPGIWLMHFMAMLGFDVPNSDVRYDVTRTVVSAVIAVGMAGVGLLIAHLGRPTPARIALAGVVTGLGVTAMHYTGMSAVRIGGTVGYDPVRVALSVIVAVVAASVALWFTTHVDGPRATWAAGALMGVAVSGMHYTGMSAVRIDLATEHAAITGMNPMFLLPPIVVIGGSLIAVLGFALSGHMEVAKMDQTYPTEAEPEPTIADLLTNTNTPQLPPRYPPELRLSGRHSA